MEGYGIDVNQKKWVGESPDPLSYIYNNIKSQNSGFVIKTNRK